MKRSLTTEWHARFGDDAAAAAKRQALRDDATREDADVLTTICTRRVTLRCSVTDGTKERHAYVEVLALHDDGVFDARVRWVLPATHEPSELCFRLREHTRVYHAAWGLFSRLYVLIPRAGLAELAAAWRLYAAAVRALRLPKDLQGVVAGFLLPWGKTVDCVTKFRVPRAQRRLL